MPIIREHLRWPLIALLVMSVVQSTSWADGKQNSMNEAAPSRSVTDWMRGVPRGCRLVSFDLLHGKRGTLAPKTRVDIIWTYVTSAGRYETTVLIKDIDILAAYPLAITQPDRTTFRVTAALTPRESRRLELAAACGTVGMSEAAGSSACGQERVSVWQIQTIEDRTEAIEADLVACDADAAILKRPTLAVPSGASPRGPGRVIAVPVEIELQP
jgi:hypothetical protein